MMQTTWIEPAAIEDVWTVNNRKENPGHIESLSESMRQNGYLPEYPIIVFRTDGISTLSTDKEYVIACGHHRRKAAIAAGIDMVYAEIYDGTEADWVRAFKAQFSDKLAQNRKTLEQDSVTPR